MITAVKSFSDVSRCVGISERWIESERAEALLGKCPADGEEKSIRHVHDAFLGFGGGPRVCPGQV